MVVVVVVVVVVVINMITITTYIAMCTHHPKTASVLALERFRPQRCCPGQNVKS